MHSPRLIEQLVWYLGKQEVTPDADRVVAGGALAIVGMQWDDLAGFADRIDAVRPVLDIRKRTPTAREVCEQFEQYPETIVLAAQPHHVLNALGLLAQPYYLPVRSLGTRPQQALPLLRQAVVQLGVTKPIEALGNDVVERLQAYRWPRGLRELREASWRIGAFLDGGNVSAAARRAGCSRQALTKYFDRRLS